MICRKSRTLLYLLLVIACLFCGSAAWANTSSRPTVGLVLGGGGAAGVAHVGVLKVLEEQGIPIDRIAGTSMGAIIGSLYAAGYSASELENIVGELDWLSLLQDGQAREQQSFQQKRENTGFFNTFELGLERGTLKLPEGLISGQQLMFELRRLLGRVAQVDDFDRLPIPFRAVATDIETGEAVVLKRGNLATAVRASMSIPGLFSPVRIDDKVLVDGFVSNNVPVDVARAMGADILIVVSIPYYFESRDNLNSALAVSYQAMQFLTAKNSLLQVEALRAPDILIEPDLKEISSLDFKRVREAMPIGEAAARQQITALKQLGVFRTKSARVQRDDDLQQTAKKVRVSKITVQNDTDLNDAVILARLGIQEGEQLDVEKLQLGLNRVYSLGYFDLVDYHLIPVVEGEEAYQLNVITRQRSTGNNRLRLGFSLEDNFQGDTSYQLGLSYNRKGVTSSGGEWRNQIVMGDRVRLLSELIQPLRLDQGSFVSLQAWHDQRDFYEYNQTERTAEVRIAETGLQVDYGRDEGDAKEWRGGVFYRYLKPDIKTGTLVLGDVENLQLAGVQFSYRVDTLDNADFPQRGRWFNALYSAGFDVLGADDTFNRLSLDAGMAWSRNNHRFLARGELGTNFANQAFVSEQLTLGGRTRLSGLAENQLRGAHVALVGLEYNYALTDIGLAKVYAGGSLEFGNVWQQRADISFGSLLTSGSLFLGFDSRIGPAYLGVAQTEGYDPTLFMQVGRRF